MPWKTRGTIFLKVLRLWQITLLRKHHCLLICKSTPKNFGSPNAGIALVAMASSTDVDVLPLTVECVYVQEALLRLLPRLLLLWVPAVVAGFIIKEGATTTTLMVAVAAVEEAVAVAAVGAEEVVSLANSFSHRAVVGMVTTAHLVINSSDMSWMP
jgi:hypothetical protein